MNDTATDVLTRLESEDYHIDAHDTPFGPLQTDTEINEHMDIDGWEYSGYMNQTEADLENHRLTDDGWEHTGTEKVDVDEHRLVWEGTHSVPGYEKEMVVLVCVEYGSEVIHMDMNGDPVEMSPGYIFTGDIFTKDGEMAGEIPPDTHKHLGEAVKSAVATLIYLKDGVLPERVDDPSIEKLDGLIESLTGHRPDR